MAPGTRGMETSDPEENVEIKTEVKKTTKGSETLVLKALSVWIKKPHVANRRLCGARILSINSFETKQEVCHKLEEIKQDELSSKDTARFESPESSSFEDLSEETGNFTLLVRELIPKSEHFPNVSQAILYDKAEKSVEFIPLKRKDFGKLHTEELTYTVQFRETEADLPEWSQVNEIVLTCNGGDDSETGKEVRRQVTWKWLRTVLLDKLVNWSQVDDISTSVTSLQLVPVDKYKETYVRLKNTYGRDLVKNWTERTDPQKYVHEDVAIAAYLLLIWENDRQKKKLSQKQTFVDLGCGNGLLVYILTKEGHKGLGIDMRKRKIWDTFGEGIDLVEQTITPSAEHLYPQYDWIIGNHSDELTPWIPVIAARSSYNCNFFVLPCCHHDFEGKFSHTNPSQSQYGAYLEYVEEIVYNCGFHPEQDTLRIPSTKRVCFIGRSRSYDEASEAKVDADRQQYIKDRISKQRTRLESLSKTQPASKGEGSVKKPYDDAVTENSLHTDQESPANTSHSGVSTGAQESNCEGPPNKIIKSGIDRLNSETDSGLGSMEDCIPSPTTAWSLNFKPRIEPGVRNCQTVPEAVKGDIVKTVFEKVLSSDSSVKADLGEGRTWRKGGAVPLEEVVNLLNPADLKQLKAECGGLQTLLRNHSHVFQVTGGKVRLRDFSEDDPFKGRKNKKARGDAGRHKTMLCWFNDHHPDGCPRFSNKCKYAHGEPELREKGPN